MHDTVPAGSTQGSQLWRATDEILARAVVVRILPPGFARADEVLAAARAASRLPDPRLVRIFDACDDDDGAYIVTEWPPGDHLDDLLAAGPLSCARACALIAAAAGALAAAHAAGVSHLCLTPRSLLWNPTTGTKIIGLGVEAALTGVLVDDQGLADTQGLASLLYATLTARWPGQNGHTLPPAPQRTGQVYPPRQVRAEVPEHLDIVVRRALLGQTLPDHPPIVTPAQMANALSAGARARVRPAYGVTSAAEVPEARVPVSPEGQRRRDDGVAAPPEARVPVSPEGQRRRDDGVAAPPEARVPVLLSGRAIRNAGRHPRSPATAGRPPRRQPADSPVLRGAAAGLATMILRVGLWAATGRWAHTTCLPPPVAAQERPVAVDDALMPADVRSFGLYAAGEGRATLASDHNPDTRWRSQWCTTARFGNLETGTGLMVDLGSQVTISGARITFGAAPGTDVQLRVGDIADSLSSLSSLRIVARVSPAVGVTDIPVTPPAVGRYLLIWFTSSPLHSDETHGSLMG
jgi:hypothetical protein